MESSETLKIHWNKKILLDVWENKGIERKWSGPIHWNTKRLLVVWENKEIERKYSGLLNVNMIVYIKILINFPQYFSSTSGGKYHRLRQHSNHQGGGWRPKRRPRHQEMITCEICKTNLLNRALKKAGCDIPPADSYQKQLPVANRESMDVLISLATNCVNILFSVAC